MHAPNFLEVEKLPAHTSFDNCNFKDVSSPTAQTFYKALRIKLHAAGDESLASLFQAFEFEAKYHTLLKKKKWTYLKYNIERM